jgi:PHD/YefM family antitoxin component YafN of YafNO toxin-antitoxin module
MAQIIPIRDLKDTNAISAKCHETDEPIFVTKNGYGDMVIMSMKVYEEKLDNARILSDLAVAENDIRYGKVRNAFDVLKDTREKYGI